MATDSGRSIRGLKGLNRGCDPSNGRQARDLPLESPPLRLRNCKLQWEMLLGVSGSLDGSR